MTFSSELRLELARHGIDARRARRIVAELEDHRACDPDAQLGSPAVIAARFASELRLTQTRRATYGGFIVLSVTALLVAAVWLGVSVVGGWPDLPGARGIVVPLGGLAAILGGQVSFVAGVLALWLLLHGTEQLRLVQRRMRVALAAGAVVVAAEAVQVVALRPSMPSWWVALGIAATVGSAIGIGGTALTLRRAAALTPAAVSAEGVPLWFAAGTGVLVVAAMTVGTAHAEGSLVEGLIRGALEGLAFAAGFLALGRFLGLRRSVEPA